MNSEQSATEIPYPRVAAAAFVLPRVLCGPDAPRFRDDVWDLMPAIPRPNLKPSQARVAFASVPAHQELLVREFLYFRLNEDGSRHASMAPSSVVGNFYLLRSFLDFLDDLRITRATATQDDLDRFLRLRSQGAVAPDSLQRYVSTIQHLDRLGDRLTGPGFTFRPWRGRRPSHVVGMARSSENRTLRIPEPVMAPLLRAAMFYVETASADILAVRSEIATLLARRQGPDHLASARLTQWIDERRTSGRGLPAQSARTAARHSSGVVGVNVKQCLLMAGVRSTAATPKMRKIIAQAVNECGLEAGGLDTPITNDPLTGMPWRTRFDRESAVKEARMLTAACYVVTAYLSGMRDSEVQGLRRGCVELEKDVRGVVVRHRLRGTVFKDRRPEGDVARWVVLPVVTRAIEVLSQLHQDDLLFTRTSYRQESRVVGHRITDLLEQFGDHVTQTRPNDAIPLVNGTKWRVTSSQFRRTVAWYIANQPFGEIAGMVQYQHVKVTTFQGYAGTSDSGFRAELEQEERDARLADVIGQYDDYVLGAKPTSRGGQALHRRFEDIRHTTDDFPGRVVDERRRLAMLEAIAGDYHAGLFNDCLLVESLAYCLTESGAIEARGKKALPILNLCSPETCANSNIRPKHRPAWAAQAAGLEHRLRQPTLTEPQRVTLESELAHANHVLEGLQ